MLIYDLCLAWDWQYDEDFVRTLESACTEQGISLLQATPHNLDDILRSLELNEIAFRSLLDRATDSSPQFLRLVEWARSHPVYRINPFGHARRSWDKGAIHQLLCEADIPTPYTIILSSFNENPVLYPVDVSLLNSCFSIKPSHGGGGKGVHNGASTWEQVLAVRVEFPDDQYLLQETVIPCVLGMKQAWFRVIYCGGEIYPCWWDTRTHLYIPLLPDEESEYELQPLRDYAEAIHRICKLDLFSTEIACTMPGRFVVVDYVNDPLDLRPQSAHCEGVPDPIVAAVANRLAKMAAGASSIEIPISRFEIIYNG